MATAAVPRKRKSTGEDNDDLHTSTKRKKDSSGSRKQSKKRSKKEKSHRSGSLRVRSVSELAKLVSTGAVRLPKSLMDYVDDRAQLLDQVFTILSPNDVKGMLPDILKELKMKRVKQLCYEQLKHLTTDEIHEAINPTEAGSTVGEPSLSTVLRELMEQEDEVVDGGDKSTASKDRGKEGTKVAVETEEQKKVAMEVEEEKDVSSSVVEVHGEKDSESSVEEIVIQVSDVSEDEGESRKGKRRSTKGLVLQPHRPVSQSEHRKGEPGHETTCKEKNIEEQSVEACTSSAAGNHSKAAPEAEYQMEVSPKAYKGAQSDEVLCERDSHEQESKVYSDHTGPKPNEHLSEGRVQEKDVDPKYPVEEPSNMEDQSVVELELRNLALESQRKRSGAWREGKQEKVKEKKAVEKALEVSEDDKAGQVIPSDESEASGTAMVTGGGGADQTTLLELKLREQALQSLLARRRQKIISGQ